ncbi:MAG TPA: Pycsar system effector family protein [Tepidisphaeraceae bacterium]|nr:Pycsar system effector family protein [Tepidisphaeraceae bacterium]
MGVAARSSYVAAKVREWEPAGRPPMQLVSDVEVEAAAAPDAGAEARLDEEKLLEAAKGLLAEVDGQVKFADTKASICVIAAGMVAARVGDNLKQGALSAMFGGGPLGVAAGVFNVLMFVALMACVTRAVLTIKPRVRRGTPAAGLWFFGGISTMEGGAFARAFREQREADVSEAVLGQVHVKSQIAARKMHGIARSLSFLAVAIAFWAMGAICAAMAR